MADSCVKALRDLAEIHLEAVLKRLPSDRMRRFVLFIEVVRAMDYWGTFAPAMGGDSEQAAQSIDLIQPGAFPLMESTYESRLFAARLMQEFGKVSLLRRLADMSERGIMEITRDGDEFQIRMSEDAHAQFADATELDRLGAAEALLPSSCAGWTTASMRDVLRFYMDASLLQGIFQLCSDEESRSSISGLVRDIVAGPDEIR